MEVSELLKLVDIVDLVSDYVDDIEEKNGEYWCLSPLKDENTPSFSMRRESGTWYDFSTGRGGNAISFLRFYHDISVREAVNKIKKRVGCNEEIAALRRLESTGVAKKFKPPKKKTKESKVKILPDNYMTRYEKDWGKLQVWIDEGISKNSLEKFEVYYDSFSNRLVYPIKNIEGKIVNFGGRTLDPDWKEKKLSKYIYGQSWGYMDVIYGLYENLEHILEKKEIIIFEGCKSVLIADTLGINNTVAILTSHLNDYQLKILIKLGCNVVFALDKDVNIKDDKNILKLKQYVRVDYIYDYLDLIGDKDSPIDKGKETFDELYERRFVYR